MLLILPDVSRRLKSVKPPLDIPTYGLASHAFNDFYNNLSPRNLRHHRCFICLSTAPYVIGTVNKPIRKLDDLKGLTIRSSGAASDKYVAALGATPRAIPVTESYESLSKAMIDGVLIAYGSLSLLQIR